MREGVSQRQFAQWLDVSATAINHAVNGSNDTTFAKMVRIFVDKYPQTGLIYEDFFPIDDPLKRIERKIDILLERTEKE